jgi:hypothetical protein
MHKNHQWVMMTLIKIRGPLINNVVYEFSSKLGLVYFAGVFASLTKSKNYEI